MNDLSNVRINGKKESDWSENWSTCNKSVNPNYDPTFFDNYCSNFYWCWRDYDYDCNPNFAFGVTET